MEKSHRLNPNAIASMISLGCLLESVELAASEFHHKITCSFQEFKNAGVCLWAQIWRNLGVKIWEVPLSLTGHRYGVQPLTLASAICMCAGEGILRESFAIPSESMPLWMVRAGVSEPLPENSKTFRKPLDDLLRSTST